MALVLTGRLSWQRASLRQRGFGVQRCMYSFFGSKGHSAGGFEVIQQTGNVSERLAVPDEVEQPSYARNPFAKPTDMYTTQRRIKPVTDPDLLSRLRDAGRLASETLDFAGSLVSPGTTTDAIDRATHEFIVRAGAYPSPLGYLGFKKSICTSVNNVIVHGVPDDRELKEGDIINIDITVFLNGVHGVFVFVCVCVCVCVFVCVCVCGSSSIPLFFLPFTLLLHSKY